MYSMPTEAPVAVDAHVQLDVPRLVGSRRDGAGVDTESRDGHLKPIGASAGVEMGGAAAVGLFTVNDLDIVEHGRRRQRLVEDHQTATRHRDGGSVISVLSPEWSE